VAPSVRSATDRSPAWGERPGAEGLARWAAASRRPDRAAVRPLQDIASRTAACLPRARSACRLWHGGQPGARSCYRSGGPSAGRRVGGRSGRRGVGRIARSIAPAVPGCEWDDDDLAALAQDREGEVSALDAEGIDVGADGCGDPQPVDRQRRDQGRARSRRQVLRLRSRQVDRCAVRTNRVGLVFRTRSSDTDCRGQRRCANGKLTESQRP
jgi:hypothetical protein